MCTVLLIRNGEVSIPVRAESVEATSPFDIPGRTDFKLHLTGSIVAQEVAHDFLPDTCVIAAIRGESRCYNKVSADFSLCATPMLGSTHLERTMRFFG